jgi:hypothetical protein
MVSQVSGSGRLLPAAAHDSGDQGILDALERCAELKGNADSVAIHPCRLGVISILVFATVWRSQ